MRIELILLGVIAIVLIVDFILRGIKKKDTSEKGIEKFEGAFEESIKQSKLHYILGRKRNILTFILLVMLVKPLIHYVFVEEKGEVSENVVNIGDGKGKLYFKSINGKLYKGANPRNYLMWQEINELRDGKANQNKDYYLEKLPFGEQGFTDYLRDGFFSKNGDEVFTDYLIKFFYYSRANPTLKSYYIKYYKSKPYFFAISLGVLLILVFLFNDKIKAR
jgi:hypothetical protein